MSHPLVAHCAGQADPVFWVLVQESEQQVLHGVAHKDLVRESQRCVADLIVETKN